MAGFVFRDGQPGDRAEALALADAASEGGDYVKWVFDKWVGDPGGKFLVAVESGSGRIAAIDKLTMLSPREGWFEGLRVHPDFQGRGLYTQIERYMIEEARRLGAEVIRFLSRTDNYVVHRNAYRNGFDMRFVVRGWTWTQPGETGSLTEERRETAPLRPATSEEAGFLYKWWRRTASSYASGGLLNRGWSFSETTQQEWVERAGQGDLLVPEQLAVADAGLPPPFVLITETTYDEAPGPEWEISTLGGMPDAARTLLQSLLREALRRGIGEVSAVLPDTYQLHTALAQAGLSQVEGYGAMGLFELTL